MELFVFTFHHNEHIYRALSPLSPEEVGERGLPTQAVLGEINANLPSMTPDQFEQNEAFVDLVHNLIREHISEIETYAHRATALGRGELLIIDERVGDELVGLTEEDILGRLQVERGALVAETYSPNPSYKVLTDKGPIRLNSVLEEHLLTYLQHLDTNVKKETTDGQ